MHCYDVTVLLHAVLTELIFNNDKRNVKVVTVSHLNATVKVDWESQ